MRTFFCVCLLAAYSMLNTGLAYQGAPSAATEKSDKGEGRGGGGGGGG